MILAGDEMGRTQSGNNNAYCQDNEISWIDWRLTEANAALLRFFRNLIAFRKSSNLVRRKTYNSGLTVVWHGVKRFKPDWGETSHTVALELSDGDERFFLIVNAYWEDLVFELPELPTGVRWRRLLDTSQQAPKDIAEPGEAFELASQDRYKVTARSVVAFIV